MFVFCFYFVYDFMHLSESEATELGIGAYL